MDEGGGLENRYTGDCIVGSNPTPSANSLRKPPAGAPIRGIWGWAAKEGPLAGPLR